MKKIRYTLYLCCTLLALSACSESTFIDSDIGEHTLSHIEVSDVKKDFLVGDIYRDALTFKVSAYYDDGTSQQVNNYQYEITQFASVDGYNCQDNNKVEIAGQYISSFMVAYTENGLTKTAGVSSTNEFASIYEKGDVNLTSFTASINNVLKPQDLLKNNLDLRLNFVWENGVEETYFMREEKDDISLSLKVQGDSSEVIDNPLVRLTNYVLKVTYRGQNVEIPFTPSIGYVKVDKNDLTILPTDFNSAYSPSSSNSVMVVPLTLHTESAAYLPNLREWNPASLNNLNEAYNGANPLSFKNYYSNLGMNLNVVITDPVDVTNPDFYVEKVYSNKKPYDGLFQVINDSFEVIKTRYTADELKVFDSNHDGQIDNINFVSNYDATNWGYSLWPHQGQTFNTEGSVDSLVVNTYCVNSFTKACTVGELTQIHEQGHVFGLLDYYDYSNNNSTNINYIGRADMQSDNIFDWNSYSKLAVGTASPYVVTGYEDSIDIDILPSAVNNDCIIIPANYDTWNGSAYDEYFLVELFSKKNINAEFWNSYGRLNDTDFGIRIYHVDSRLYDQFKDKEASDNKEDWSGFTIVGANNSSDYKAPGLGNPAEWGDYKQLCLIQKEGIDTFGDEISSHHYLLSSDMFYAGEEFNFNDYKHFLSKSGQTVTTMDNGEDFPWTIKIVSANIDGATIRIYK